MANAPINPITLSVIWNGFLAIAEEMGTTLQMTAFSEAVREGQDFSTAIFDRRGRLVAQGNFTPGHLGSMPYVIKSIMEIFPPGALHPGDGVLLNDSRLGSGHYPDFFFVCPVFLAQTQVGYLINTAHHIDVGGAAPGSQKVQGISERFQEGLRILPVRVQRAGGAVGGAVVQLLGARADRGRGIPGRPGHVGQRNRGVTRQHAVGRAGGGVQPRAGDRSPFGEVNDRGRGRAGRGAGRRRALGHGGRR